MTSKNIHLSIYLCFIFLLTACDGKNDNSPPNLHIPQNIEIYENQTEVLLIEVSDADGDELSLSIFGDDAGAFIIEDRVLLLRQPPDYESKKQYSLKIL